jgi:hypothetical protein
VLKVLLCFFLIPGVAGTFFLSAPLLARGKTASSAVVVETSQGSINSKYPGYEISIIGTVKNHLPIPVTNVKVQVYIPEIKKTAAKVLPGIKPRASEVFIIIVYVKNKVSNFTTQVVDYGLQSDNVSLLLKYFWERTNDTLLRKAVVAGLENMPVSAIPRVINRFKNPLYPTSATGINNRVIETLLLLPALTGSKNLEAVRALVQKQEQFSSELYELSFSVLKQFARRESTIIPLLNRAAQEGKTLRDLFCDAVVKFGHQAMPILVRNTYISLKSAGVTDCALRKLGVDTPEKQMKALLSAVSLGSAQRKAVTDVLDELTPGINHILFKLLETADAEACECLIAQLQKQGKEALPSLISHLRQSGLQVPPAVKPKEALNRLVTLYTHRRLSHIEKLNKNTRRSLETGKASQLKKDLNLLLTLRQKANNRYLYSQYTDFLLDIERSQSLLNGCLTREAREHIDYHRLNELLNREAQYIQLHQGERQAQLFWQQVPTLYPDLSLRRKIGGIYLAKLKDTWTENNWPGAALHFGKLEPYIPYLGVSQNEIGELYLQQGRKARTHNQWQQAMTYFKKSRTYFNDVTIAQAEIGKTFVRQKWLLLVFLLAIVIISGAIIRKWQKKLLKQE